MRDLGYINGWQFLEPEVKAEYEKLLHDCYEQGHGHNQSELFGRCHNQYTCHKCKFTYKVDSSD